MDADGIFEAMFKNAFQETLLIPMHAVARVKHKAIINLGFHFYFNKFQKINSVDNVILNKWLQGVFFTVFLECMLSRRK